MQVRFFGRLVATGMELDDIVVSMFEVMKLLSSIECEGN